MNSRILRKKELQGDWKGITFLIAASICFGYYSFLFPLIGLITVYSILVNRKKHQKTKLFLGWFLVCILWLVSSIYSATMIRGVKYTITLICIFYLSIVIKEKKEMQEWFINNIYFMTIIHVFFTILRQVSFSTVDTICQIILPIELYQAQVKFYSGGIWNGNLGISTQTGWNAFFITLEMGIAFIYWKENRSKKQNIHFILLVLGGIALLLTNKRSYFIAIMIAFIALFHFYAKKKAKMSTVLKIILGIIFFGVGVYIAYRYIPGITGIFDKIKSLSGRSLDTISSGRISIYTEILEKLQSIRIIIGYGMGSTDAIIGLDGHNIYLQILFENGIIGLSLFLYVFAYVYIRTWRKIKLQLKIKRNSIILSFSLYFQTVFLIYGLFGNPLYDTPILFMYLIVIFLADGYQISTEC